MQNHIRTRLLTVLMVAGLLGVTAGCMQSVPRLPIACIDADPSIGYAPLTVTFDASCSFIPPEAAGVYSFVWDFDDEATGTGRTITHTFLDPGTYMVSVGMNDSGGIPVDAAVRTITVLPVP